MRLPSLALILAGFAGPLAAQSTDGPDSGTGGPVDQGKVAAYLRYFTGPARDRMSRWLARGGQYRNLIRNRLAEDSLPSSLEYLPLIESGYSNQAVSRAGAVGMWQLIPKTARRYGLRIDRFVDERRDPWRATDAAIRHIRDLTREFGSPLLAAAAYNGGAGRVRRGLERLGPADSSAGLDSTFRDLDFFRLSRQSLLPAETREYVPELLAAAAIGDDPERFGFTRPAGSLLTFDSVLVRRSISLGAAARAVGLQSRSIADLNPHFIRGTTPPGRPSWLRVPVGFADDLAEKLPSLPTAAAPRIRRTYTRVRVRRGDTVADLAARFQVPADSIRRSNALPRSYRIRPGQVLWVPTRETKPAERARPVTPSS